MAVEDSLQCRLWIILSDNCDSGIRLVPCGADEHIAVFWAYRDRGDSRLELNRLAWHDCTMSPEVREQAGHEEGLVQLYLVIIMPGGTILVPNLAIDTGTDACCSESMAPFGSPI